MPSSLGSQRKGRDQGLDSEEAERAPPVPSSLALWPQQPRSCTELERASFSRRWGRHCTLTPPEVTPVSLQRDPRATSRAGFTGLKPLPAKQKQSHYFFSIANNYKLFQMVKPKYLHGLSCRHDGFIAQFKTKQIWASHAQIPTTAHQTARCLVLHALSENQLMGPSSRH